MHDWQPGDALTSERLNKTGASIITPIAGENITVGDAMFLELYSVHEEICTKSTWVNEASPTTNYNSDQDLTLSDASSNKNQGLIEFTMSGFPSSANRLAAFLQLSDSEQDSEPGPQDNTVTLTNVTSSWTDSTVTWNTKPSIGVETATLKHELDSDLDPYTGVTLIDDIYDYWQDTSNYGLYVTTDDGTGSHEFASDASPQSAYRPKLIVYGKENVGKVYKTYSEGRIFVGYATETITATNPVKVEGAGIFDDDTGLTVGPVDSYQDTYCGFATSSTEILILKNRFEIKEDDVEAISKNVGASIDAEWIQVIPPHCTEIHIALSHSIGAGTDKIMITVPNDTSFNRDFDNAGNTVEIRVKVEAASNGFNYLTIRTLNNENDQTLTGEVRYYGHPM